MQILIIAEKKKQVEPYLQAFENRHVKANYLRISKITLVSRHGKTSIKSLGEELPIYDAIFIQARPSLAPFIEPLLEETEALNYYCTAKKGAYFTAWNEPFQYVTLALASIPAPKTISAASPKIIEQNSSKINYPIVAKTFQGKKEQQAIIVENSRELNSFARSLKTEIDAFLIREFIEGAYVSCAVVGDKVFAVKRTLPSGKVCEIREGQFFKLSEKDTQTAIKAREACGLDIARVDLTKGKVIKVEPFIALEEFNTACSEKIEEHIADFLIEKAKAFDERALTENDLLGIKRILSKTIFGRLFK